MKSRNILLSIVIVIIIGIGAYVVFLASHNNRTAMPSDRNINKIASDNVQREDILFAQLNNNTNQNQTGDQPEDMVKVNFPQSNDAVGSPLVVTGIARGSWFFEGDFPVRLKDANGNDITIASARAQGDWMTENFVPFIAELNFDPGSMKEAKLVLERNNPSGMQENNRSIEIPINIDPQKSTIKIFFTNENLPASCNNVVAVSRSIDKRDEQMERKALVELFKGTTNREDEFGYKTSINSGVDIKNLQINNGVARVDLSDDLNKNVGDSCRASLIRAQIIETLKQFPTVKSVEISVNGNTDVLQP